MPAVTADTLSLPRLAALPGTSTDWRGVHKDSTGGGGLLIDGATQWMTAGRLGRTPVPHHTSADLDPGVTDGR